MFKISSKIIKISTYPEYNRVFIIKSKKNTLQISKFPLVLHPKLVTRGDRVSVVLCPENCMM